MPWHCERRGLYNLSPYTGERIVWPKNGVFALFVKIGKIRQGCFIGSIMLIHSICKSLAVRMCCLLYLLAMYPLLILCIPLLIYSHYPLSYLALVLLYEYLRCCVFSGVLLVVVSLFW